MRLLGLIALVCLVRSVAAQDDFSSAERYIMDVFQQYAEESEEEIDFEPFYDELLRLLENPLDLNHAVREDLDKMFFLSGMQIENILYYLYKSGGMQTIFELQLIEGLDMTDIRRMLPFVSLGDVVRKEKWPEWKQIVKYGKNEVMTFWAVVPEKKRGYLDVGESGRVYAGGPLSHYMKYRFGYKDRVFLNFTSEKDAGERFFGKAGRGYDFYSASMQVKRAGIFHNVILGDYTAGFGQGLVVGRSLRTGKSSSAVNVFPRETGFRKYGSVNENNFFRGGAISVSLGKAGLNLFYSGKRIDGNIKDGRLTGLYTSGYHRTESEIAKKQVIGENIFGGNLNISGLYYQVGMTCLYYHIDRPVQPDFHPYNLFYFRGTDQFCCGLNYRLRAGRFLFRGETAIIDAGAPATINGLTFSPASKITLSLLHRYYAPEYNALLASGFSENSRLSNESGCYSGIEMTPFRKWKFTFYADIFRFPWLKYGVSAPSDGIDLMFQGDFHPDKKLNMVWRLKYKRNEKDVSGTYPVPLVCNQHKGSFRYHWNYAAGWIGFGNTVDANVVGQNGKLTYGIADWVDISFTCPGIPLKVDLRYMYFDAVEYANRIYAYEKDVLYAFSIPAFHGMGGRYYVNLKYDISKRFSLWFRFSRFVYTDERESTGTGTEMISGNKKTELKALFRWNFHGF